VSAEYWQAVSEGFAAIATVGAAEVIPVKSPKAVSPAAVIVVVTAPYFTHGNEPSHFPVLIFPTKPFTSEAAKVPVSVHEKPLIPELETVQYLVR